MSQIVINCVSIFSDLFYFFNNLKLFTKKIIVFNIIIFENALYLNLKYQKKKIVHIDKSKLCMNLVYLDTLTLKI